MDIKAVIDFRINVLAISKESHAFKTYRTHKYLICISLIAVTSILFIL
jgi:hypothetical protein